VEPAVEPPTFDSVDLGDESSFFAGVEPAVESSPFGEQGFVTDEPSPVEEKPSGDTEPHTIFAEVVVEDSRSSVPDSTQLSRLAAGSILEQIGKLLGSL
jgi:hypothetical protein